MNHLILIPMLLFGVLKLWAQPNLVPNSSFEQNTGCPTSNYQIQLAYPWAKVGGDGGMFYFHDCGTTQFQSMDNLLGYGGARSGEGMAAIVLFYNNHCSPIHGEGNFIGTPLLSALEHGKKYRVRFYISLCDYQRYASRNIGVHFSYNQPLNNTPNLLSLLPQISYSGDFLTNKVSWMRIEGEFIAAGGESYLTIGNFDGYANSDTLNLNEGGTQPSICSWEYAQYYIDDVSVTEVDSTLEYEEVEEVREPYKAVGVEEQLTTSNEQLRIWPNPVGESLRFEVQGSSPSTSLRVTELKLSVTDILGRAVEIEFIEAYQGTLQAQVWHLASGVYLLSATGKNGRVWRTKFLKE